MEEKAAAGRDCTGVLEFETTNEGVRCWCSKCGHKSFTKKRKWGNERRETLTERVSKIEDQIKKSPVKE